MLQTQFAKFDDVTAVTLRIHVVWWMVPGVSTDRSAFRLEGDAVRGFGLLGWGVGDGGTVFLVRLCTAGPPSTIVSVGSLPACVSSVILYTAELLTRGKLRLCPDIHLCSYGGCFHGAGCVELAGVGSLGPVLILSRSVFFDNDIQ